MITLAIPSPAPDAIKTQIDWLNDPAVVRFSEQRHKKHTVASQFDYIKSFLDHPDNILREIRLDGRLIGTISAYIDRHNRVADVGMLIGPDFQGGGYGFEAWSMLGEILFDNVNMRRIEAGCMELNTPMIKIFRRYGMREEGRRMSHFIVSGTYSDLVLYGRFR